VYHCHLLFQGLPPKILRVASAPTALTLKLLVGSSLVWVSANSSIMSDTHFLNPDKRLDCSLHDLQQYSMPGGLINISLASQSQLLSEVLVFYAVAAF
jgi:hypothetical protein